MRKTVLVILLVLGLLLSACSSDPGPDLSAYKPPFDIEVIRADMIGWAKELGDEDTPAPELDETLTTWNASYEKSVPASESLQGQDLYDALKNMVLYHSPDRMTETQGRPIERFNIFVIENNGTYNIYFLY